LSDSTKRIDFVVKNLMQNLKVFEQLPFETIDDYAKQHFVHPLKSVKIGRALLETSNCENLLKIL
jgi:hypothetical protein